MPALKVRLVIVVSPNGPLEAKVIVEEPKVTALVFEPVEVKFDIVILKFPVSKEPLLTVKDTEEVNALPKVQPPPTPLNTAKILAKETPLVVTVFPVVVAKKFIVLPAVVVKVQFVAGNVSEP